jgi:hypothetical protein
MIGQPGSQVDSPCCLVLHRISIGRQATHVESEAFFILLPMTFIGALVGSGTLIERAIPLSVEVRT